MRTIHKLALLISAILALFVGIWAYFIPEGFYSSFPGLGLQWISSDGAFNEHLIRDVGGMYLALAAASIVGLVRFTSASAPILGAAWTVFGLLHFSYHLAHLSHMEPLDAFAEIATLGLSLLLGIALLIPDRATRDHEKKVQA